MPTEKARVVKGGSYQSVPAEARCEAEQMLSSQASAEYVGFRVLLDLAAEAATRRGSR